MTASRRRSVQEQNEELRTSIQCAAEAFRRDPERYEWLAETLMAGEKDSIKRVAIIGGKTPEGDIPTILTWDGLQAIAQLAPNAEVVLPTGDGEFSTHRITEVPGYLLSRAAATGI